MHTTNITNHLNSAVKSKRSQSALEYMMTYGWAILIIVIVAVILYSMGIFNPSSSITTTSIGFSPFTVSSTVCSPAGLSVAIIGGGLPDTATQAVITKIYITSNTGTTALTKAYTLNPVTISPGKTATIVIPTVACTSANVKYSLSAKLQYSYSTPAGNVITNTTGRIAGTSSANPIVKYVPLTITSSAATPSPFQQMVIVNMNNYNSYASSNLQNIEFTYPNGTIIPSWRENGTTNTQTVVYWLKLGSFTTATVYMDFFSTSSNVLNPVNTGEAPQLTCSNPSDTASCSTYAEYDNGANVFNDYWNFAGTSLPSGLSATAACTTTNNGLTIAATSGACGIYTDTTINSNDNVLESYMQQAGYGSLLYSISATGGYYSDTSWITSGSSSGESYNGVFSPNPNNQIITSINGVQYDNSVSYSYPSSYTVYGVINVNNLAYDTVNYTTVATAPTSDTPLGQNYFAQLFSTGSTDILAYWLRTRAYPPNGVMPSISFGSVA